MAARSYMVAPGVKFDCGCMYPYTDRSELMRLDLQMIELRLHLLQYLAFSWRNCGDEAAIGIWGFLPAAAVGVDADADAA